MEKNRTTIYLDCQVKKINKELCSADKISLSQRIEQLLSRYAMAHVGGNPQTLLGKFAGPITKTCFHCQRKFEKPLKKVLYVSGLKALTCDDCLKETSISLCVKKVLG